ncbi:MAG: penicillin-binding protein 2 [Sphingomonadales bacterium]
MLFKNQRIDRFKVFSRRAALLAGVKGVLFAGLAGRMYYLQVVESNRYLMLAEENRISVRLIAPLRGLIVDRFGEILAANRADYRAYLVPEQAPDVGATLRALNDILDLTRGDLDRIERTMRQQRAFLPVTVAANLSWEEFASLNLASPDLPGIQPDVGSTRYYPHAELIAHLVGYVGAPNENEVGRDPVLQLPGFRVGRNGIERAFDQRLRGSAGNMKVEVNAVGRVIRELERENSTQGSPVQLTIDLGLQKFAAARLGSESASAVVMDTETGDILAMATVPAFDPNDFNLGISRTRWQQLITDERKPLMNKAVSGVYPPGSTYKMAVALAALESGVIEADHRVTCTGSRRLGNHTFHCWRHRGHGPMDMAGAIKESCDIYFYDIADRVGIEKIAEMSRRLGLGDAPSLPISSVAAGLIPSPGWKLATHGVPWQRGETLILGIGQGYVTTSPLQLAIMTARLANGRYAVVPRMAVGGDGIPDAVPLPLGLSATALDIVRDGMARVMLDQRGTAYNARIREPGFSMAGKTGTAQVRRITQEERDAGIIANEDRQWAHRDHALFVGYGPIEAPRYAIAVVVEHGGGGASVAAPIARDILLTAMKRKSAAPPRQPDTEHDMQPAPHPPSGGIEV